MRISQEEMKNRLAMNLEKIIYDGNKVRLGGRRPQYSGVDGVNFTVTTKFAAETFKHTKILCPRWHEWTEEEHSIPSKLLKNGIAIPYEYSAEFYWNEVLRKMFITKIRGIKNNFISIWREEYLGEQNYCNKYLIWMC